MSRSSFCIVLAEQSKVHSGSSICAACTQDSKVGADDSKEDEKPERLMEEDIVMKSLAGLRNSVSPLIGKYGGS